jgi:hypothetical protein|tara:strand:- start:1959 stop:2123 length:165 start_codon:yes stop_codon:yes gene_type:complete
MVEEKLETLKEDLKKVTMELDRLTQLRLKLLGAIEVLDQINNEEEVEDGSDDSK